MAQCFVVIQIKRCKYMFFNRGISLNGVIVVSFIRTNFMKSPFCTSYVVDDKPVNYDLLLFSRHCDFAQ